jgi:hypothetical protein
MSFTNPGDGKRCDWCDTPGIPYEYKGVTLSGLCACEGDHLCPRCRDIYLDQKVEDARELTGVSVISGPGRYRDWSEIRKQIKDR